MGRRARKPRSPRAGAVARTGLLLVAVILSLANVTSIEPHEPQPTADWTQWRGPGRAAMVKGFVAPESWPSELRPLWRAQVGAGYSTPVVLDQGVWIHTRIGSDETVTAMSYDTGIVRWRDRYPAPSIKSPAFAAMEGEGPYATPVLHQGRLYTVGVYGVVSAFNAFGGGTGGGVVVWRRDLSDLIVETHGFCGVATSPLIVEDTVIVQVGDADSSEIMALALEDGSTRWSLAGPGISSASPMLVELDGHRQLVTLTERGVLGIDPEDGTQLWTYPHVGGWPGACSRNIATPVFYDSSVILSSILEGTSALSIHRDSDSWGVDLLWNNADFAAEWSNLVLDGDTLYGISQRNKGQLFSLDVMTGEARWNTGGRSGENGFVVSSDDLVFFLMNEADLLVMHKGPNGLHEKARYTVADTTIWSYPIIRNDGILVKDSRTLTRWSFD